MKRLPLLLLLCLGLAGCATMEIPEAPAELPSEQPFKGADVILIESGDSPAEARENVSTLLRLLDYEISQGTLNGPVIETEPRTFGSGTPGAARYFFAIPEEAGEPVRLYGEWIANQATDTHSFLQFPSAPIEPRGDRRSTPWLAWLEMVELADSYHGGTLLYDTQ